MRFVFVIAGLDPAIHVVPQAERSAVRTGVDARNKSGHDGLL